MAAQETHLPLRSALLVLCSLVYQTPLLAVTLAAAFGKHEHLMERVA